MKKESRKPIDGWLDHEYELTDSAIVSAYDELSLWAAPFGLRLLETVKMQSHLTGLDVGCGTGFPLLELAQRLGASGRMYGIDPWEEGLKRFRSKMRALDIKNAAVVRAFAEEMPFADSSFDLIVSNNGMNNVEDPERVLRECFRISRSGAQIVMTMNLPGTMVEFYDTYIIVLRDLEKERAIAKLHDHIFTRRKPLHLWEGMIEDAGFRIASTIEDAFVMRFANGTAMLNHRFIRMWFLGGWQSILSQDEVSPVFHLLEERLNEISKQRGELKLTIPLVCFSGFKMDM